MNTRILRMCSRFRYPKSGELSCRSIRDMGQLQPVLFGIEHGRPTLRIEGMASGRACWWVLPLPKFKAQAKSLFAELEAHKRNGTRGPAAKWWANYQATREPRKV